jgi:hypothetical protein
LNSFLGGTLVISLPCNEGVLVCSDRLVTHKREDSESTGAAQKAYAIGSNGIFATAGTTAAVDSAGHVVYSVERELQRYLRTVDARTLDKRIHSVNDLLGDTLRTLTSKAVPDFVPPGHVAGSDFFTVLIWYRDLAKAIRGYLIRATYDWGASRKGNVSVHPIVDGRLEIASPLAIGHDAPLDELRFGDNTMFASFRADPDIALLYSNPPMLAADVSVEDATRLCKKLMIVAIEMIRLKGLPASVGSRTDGALLSFTSGVVPLWTDEL